MSTLKLDPTLMSEQPSPEHTATPPSTQRAIEVAAVLDDTLVEVRHLTDPQGGRVSRPTRAILAAGALALVICVLSFVRGVAFAGAEQAELKAWTEAGKAPIDFHPERLPAAWDLLAVSGLILGVAFVGFGLSRAQNERRTAQFRIGRATGVEHALDDLPAGVDSFQLVRPEGAGFVFQWTDGMAGELIVDGKTTPLASLPRTMPVPQTGRLRATLGKSVFFVSSVPAPRATGTASSFDRRVAAFAGVSAAAHGVVLALLFMTASGTTGYSSDDDANEAMRTAVRISTRESAKLEDKIKPPGTGGDKGQNGAPGATQPLAGAEGVRGKQNAPVAENKGEIKKTNPDAPQSVAKKRERAATAGILGILNAQTDRMEAVVSAADFSNGLNDRDIQGGWTGINPGEQRGWGWGLKHNGPGGGGVNDRTVGDPRYATLRDPKWGGSDYKTGPGGPGGPGGRTPKGPEPYFGKVTTSSEVDPKIIRRYVRARADQLTYCYTKHLHVKPHLEGTVNVRFSIDAQGRVVASEASGLDSDVSSCIADVVSTIEFPSFGQLVNITSYPLVFHRTGA